MKSHSASPLLRVSFAEYLAGAIETSPKTQREIAIELGYDRANIITMFKRGHTKVPIEKIPALASSLDLDVAYLMRRALSEYMPHAATAIFASLGEPVTSNENAILAFIRDASGEGDPPLSEGLKAALRSEMAWPKIALS